MEDNSLLAHKSHLLNIFITHFNIKFVVINIKFVVFKFCDVDMNCIPQNKISFYKDVLPL